ncbi:MAG TPA: hypothetical protein VHR45_25610 [Thermoanaerobaculia bacterium]|nr:hypothetical protein [Thermoanaerobaculia bacterium]
MGAMQASTEPLRYTEEELRSFLPSGWDLAGNGEGTGGRMGSWDPEKRVWSIRVLDNVEFDWPLVVKEDDALALGPRGRLEALRRAMDKVYRERLG